MYSHRKEGVTAGLASIVGWQQLAAVGSSWQQLAAVGSRAAVLTVERLQQQTLGVDGVCPGHLGQVVLDLGEEGGNVLWVARRGRGGAGRLGVGVDMSVVVMLVRGVPRRRRHV